MTSAFLFNPFPSRILLWLNSHIKFGLKENLCFEFEDYRVPCIRYGVLQKAQNFDARSIRCRFLGFSEYENECRFREVESGRVLVSCDAKLMKDTFDSGRRDRHYNEVVDQDDYDATHQNSPHHERTDYETDKLVQEQEVESLAILETNGPYCSKRRVKWQGLNDRVDINYSKKCRPQRKT